MMLSVIKMIQVRNEIVHIHKEHHIRVQYIRVDRHFLAGKKS